mmetsp:Transcript_18321/g.37148  ORF Transcript_18321/g.37148 Transcript_18321/m.37148 type:complete len:112 (-) Transcript_18321:21-356(-)
MLVDIDSTFVDPNIAAKHSDDNRSSPQDTDITLLHPLLPQLFLDVSGVPPPLEETAVSTNCHLKSLVLAFFFGVFAGSTQALHFGEVWVGNFYCCCLTDPFGYRPLFCHSS